MIDEKEVIYRPRHKHYSTEVNGSDFKISKVVKYSDDGYALNTYIFETTRDKFVETKEEQSARRGNEKISIIISQKSTAQQKKEQNPKEEENTQRYWKSENRSSSGNTGEYLKILPKNCSTPDVNKAYVNRKQKKKNSCSDTYINKITPIDAKFIVNTVLLEPHTTPPNCQDLLKHPLMQAQMRIYRCQLGSHEEKYCQACDSDAFFDVLKGLYDCYTNKNCVNCNCILCGSFHKAKRKLLLGEASRSKVSVGVETVATKHKTKETLKKTKDHGLTTSLSGKPTEQKETKIAAISKEPLSAQLEKFRKAQASGILPTLEGYSYIQREKTSNALIQSGSPLNGRKKTPDNKVINQVRKELGLPLESRPVLANERDSKSITLGKTAMFEKKTQKETILRATAEKRMPSRDARPTIELKKMPPDTRAQSEKLRKSRGGLLIPDESEYKLVEFPDNKQHEIRLADGKTLSEIQLIDNIRKELGLTTPITKSALAKILKPILSRSHMTNPSPATLEKKRKVYDKTSKITKEGKGDLRLASFLTSQINKKTESKTASPCRITFETVKAAETAGLFSQLQGKSQTEKEKVIRSLANQEIPFPEAKTPSEKKIAKKIRAQLGLPPAPSTKFTQTVKSEKYKAQSLITQVEGKRIAQYKKNISTIETPEHNTPYSNEINRKVKSASVIASLKGETPEQRTLLLRKLNATNSKLTEERTSSDKSPAQRMTISRTKGLVITPERKSQYNKEKMLRRLAKSGLPLPEGRTASDKELIKKIRTEVVLPLETITPSLKEKFSVARTTCNRVPLDNKISTQAENIIKRISDTRIQLVQCSSPKENSKSVRSIKTGTGHVRKTKGNVTESVAVIKEDGGEKDNIIGTCEMGCGCNKKKIRFKHSYVKIRVTSPDTSSFCSCLHDCPGIRSGAFADNEGIKVTVETATGLPSYKVQPATPLKQTLLQYPVSKHSEEEFHDYIYSQSHISLEISSVESDYTTDYSSSTSIVYIYNSESDVSISDIKRMLRESIDSGDFDESITDYRQRDKPVSYIYQSRFAISRAGIQRNYNQTAQVLCPVPDSCSGSYYSIETVSSSALADSNYIRDTLSVLSSLARNLGFSTDSILLQRSVNEEYYDTEYTESLVKETDLVPVDTLLRNSRYLIDSSQESHEHHNFEEDVAIYRQTLQPFRSKSLKLQQVDGRRIMRAKKNVISSTRLTGSSSIFIMVSTSGIDQPYSSQYLDTMSKSQSSQNILSKARAWMDTKKMKLSRFEIFNRKRSHLKRNKQKGSNEEHGIKKSIHSCAKAAHKIAMKCQASAGKMKDQRPSRALSMDTARDRLRYCTTDEGSKVEPSQSKSNVISEIIQPMIAREKVAQGLIKDAYMKMEYNQIPSSTCYPSDSAVTTGGYVTPAQHSGYSMKPDESSQREYDQHYNNNVDSNDWGNHAQYSAEPDMLTPNSEVSLASTIYSSIGARSRGCVNPALYTAQRRKTKKCSDDCKSQKPVKKAKSCVCENGLNANLSSSSFKPPDCASKKGCLNKDVDSSSSKKKHSRASMDSQCDKIITALDSVTYTKKKKRHGKKSSLKKRGRSLDSVKSCYTQKESNESADSRRLQMSFSQDSAQYRCVTRSSPADSSESRCGKHQKTSRHHLKSGYAKRSSSNDGADAGYEKKSHSHHSSRHRHRKKRSPYDSTESSFPKKCSHHDSVRSRYLNKCSYHDSMDSRNSRKYSYHDGMESRYPKTCSHYGSVESSHQRKCSHHNSMEPRYQKKYSHHDSMESHYPKKFSYHASSESRHRKRNSPLDSMESRYTQKSSYGSDESPYTRKGSPVASIKSGHSTKCCSRHQAESSCANKYPSNDDVKIRYTKKYYIRDASSNDSVNSCYGNKTFSQDSLHYNYSKKHSPYGSLTSSNVKKSCSHDGTEFRRAKKYSDDNLKSSCGKRARDCTKPHHAKKHSPYDSVEPSYKDECCTRHGGQTASDDNLKSSCGKKARDCAIPHYAKKHSPYDSVEPSYEDKCCARHGGQTPTSNDVLKSSCGKKARDCAKSHHAKKHSPCDSVETNHEETCCTRDGEESRPTKKYPPCDSAKPYKEETCCTRHGGHSPASDDNLKSTCRKKARDCEKTHHAKKDSPCGSLELSSEETCCTRHGGESQNVNKYSPSNSLKSSDSKKCCSHHGKYSRCTKKHSVTKKHSPYDNLIPYDEKNYSPDTSHIKSAREKRASQISVRSSAGRCHPCDKTHKILESTFPKKCSYHEGVDSGFPQKHYHNDAVRSGKAKKTYSPDSFEPYFPEKCNHNEKTEPCYPKKCTHHDNVKPSYPKSCSHHDVGMPCGQITCSHEDSGKACCQKKGSYQATRQPCCQKQDSQDTKQPCSQKKGSCQDIKQPCCIKKCSHEDIKKSVCKKKCSHERCSHHDAGKPCCQQKCSHQDIGKPCCQKKCSHHDTKKPPKKKKSLEDLDKCSHHNAGQPCCHQKCSHRDIGEPCCQKRCSHHDMKKSTTKKKGSRNDTGQSCFQKKCSHHDAGQPCCQKKCSHQDIGIPCCQVKCPHHDDVEPSKKKKRGKKPSVECCYRKKPDCKASVESCSRQKPGRSVSVDSCVPQKCTNRDSFDSDTANICPRQRVKSCLPRASCPDVSAEPCDSKTKTAQPCVPKSCPKRGKSKERRKSEEALKPCQCPKQNPGSSKQRKSVFQRLMASMGGTCSKEHINVDLQSSCNKRSRRDSMSGRDSVTSHKDSMTSTHELNECQKPEAKVCTERKICCGRPGERKVEDKYAGMSPSCKRPVCSSNDGPPRAEKSLSPIKIEPEKEAEEKKEPEEKKETEAKKEVEEKIEKKDSETKPELKKKEKKEKKQKKAKEKKEQRTECQCPLTDIINMVKVEADLDDIDTCCPIKQQEPSGQCTRDTTDKSCLTKEQNAMLHVMKRMSEYLKDTGSIGDCDCNPKVAYTETCKRKTPCNTRKCYPHTPRPKEDDNEEPEEFDERRRSSGDPKRRTQTRERDEVGGCRRPSCIARKCNPHGNYAPHPDEKRRPCGRRHADCKNYLKTRKAKHENEVVTKITDLTNKASPCLCNSALFEKMLNKVMKEACFSPPAPCGRPHPQTPDKEKSNSVSETPVSVKELPKPVEESPTAVQESIPAPAATQESSNLPVETTPAKAPEELRNREVEVEKSPDLVPQQPPPELSPGAPDVVPQQQPNVVVSHSSILLSQHFPYPDPKERSYNLSRQKSNTNLGPLPMQVPESKTPDIFQQSPNVASEPTDGRITHQNLNAPLRQTVDQITQQSFNLPTEPTGIRLTQRKHNAALGTGPGHIPQQLLNTPRMTQRLTNTAQQTRVAHVYQNFPNNLSYHHFALFSRHTNRNQSPLDSAQVHQSHNTRYNWQGTKQSEKISQTNIDSLSEHRGRRNPNNLDTSCKCEPPKQKHDDFAYTLSCSACEPVVVYNNSTAIRPSTLNNIKPDNTSGVISCSACDSNVRKTNVPRLDSIPSWNNAQHGNAVHVNCHPSGPTQNSPNVQPNFSKFCSCTYMHPNKTAQINLPGQSCPPPPPPDSKGRAPGYAHSAPSNPNNNCPTNNVCSCKGTQIDEKDKGCESCLQEAHRKINNYDPNTDTKIWPGKSMGCTNVPTKNPPVVPRQYSQVLPRYNGPAVYGPGNRAAPKTIDNACKCEQPKNTGRTSNLKTSPRDPSACKSCGNSCTACKCDRLESNIRPGSIIIRPENCLTEKPRRCSPCNPIDKSTMVAGPPKLSLAQIAKNLPRTASGTVICVDRKLCEKLLSPCLCGVDACKCYLPDYPIRRTTNTRCTMKNQQGQTCGARAPVGRCLQREPRKCPLSPLCGQPELAGPGGGCFQGPETPIPTAGPDGQFNNGYLNQMIGPNGQMLGPEGHNLIPHQQTPGDTGKLYQNRDRNMMGPRGALNKGYQTQEPYYPTMGPQGQIENPNYETMGPQEQMQGPNYRPIGPQGQIRDSNYQPMGPQGQMENPNYRPMGHQGQMEDPNYRPMGPQGQMEGPNYPPMGPQGQMRDFNYQPMDAQGQMRDSNYQPMGPQGQMEDPNYRPMGPQGQMEDPNYRPMGPQEQIENPNHEMWGPQAQQQAGQEPNYDMIDSQGKNPNMQQEMTGLDENLMQNPDVSMVGPDGQVYDGRQSAMIGPNDQISGQQQQVNRYYQMDPTFQGQIKMPYDQMLNPQGHVIRMHQQTVNPGQMTQSRSVTQKQNNVLLKQMPYLQELIIKSPSGKITQKNQGPLRSGILNRTNKSLNLMTGAQGKQLSSRQQMTHPQGQIVQNLIQQTENEAREGAETVREPFQEDTGLDFEGMPNQQFEGDIIPPQEQIPECTCQTKRSCFNQKVWKDVPEPCPCGPDPGPLVVVERTEKARKCSDVLVQIKSFFKTKLKKKSDGKKTKMQNKADEEVGEEETQQSAEKKEIDKEAGPTVQIIYGPQGHMLGRYPDHISRRYPDNATEGYAERMAKGFTNRMAGGYTDHLVGGYTDHQAGRYPDQMEEGYTDQMDGGYPGQMEENYQMEGGYPDPIIEPREQMNERYHSTNPLDAIIYGPEGKMIGSSVGTMTQVSQDQLRSRYNLLLDPQDQTGSQQWPSRKGSQGQVMYHTRGHVADYPSGQSSYYRWLGSQGQMDFQRSYSGGRILPGHASRICHEELARKSQGQSRCSSYDRKECSRHQIPFYPYDQATGCPPRRFDDDSWNNISASCSCRPTEDAQMPCQGTQYYQYLAGPMAAGPQTRYIKGPQEHIVYKKQRDMESWQSQSEQNQKSFQEDLNRNNYQQQVSRRISYAANTYDIRPKVSGRDTEPAPKGSRISYPEALNLNPEVPRTPSIRTSQAQPMGPAHPMGPRTSLPRGSLVYPVDSRPPPPGGSPMGPRPPPPGGSPMGPRPPSPGGSPMGPRPPSPGGSPMGPRPRSPSGSPMGPRPPAQPMGPRPQGQPMGPRPQGQPMGPRPQGQPMGPRPQAQPMGPRPPSPRGSQLRPMGAGTPPPKASQAKPKTQLKEGKAETSNDSDDKMEDPVMVQYQTDKQKHESEALKTLLIKAAKRGGCSKEMCCSWHDLQKACLKELREMKSDLSRSTSGFQISQTKRPLVFCTSDSSLDSSEYSSEVNSECSSVKPSFKNKFKNGFFSQRRKSKDKSKNNLTTSESDKTADQDQVIVIEDDTFQGLKFYVEGKGGDSPELQSVPCSGCPASKAKKPSTTPTPAPNEPSLVPVKLPSISPQQDSSIAPQGQPSVAAEPVRQPTVIPEPVRQPSVVPEPVKQPSVAPEPVRQPSVAPEPVRQPTLIPEPVRQPTVAPEPVRQPTVAPEPVKQPSVAPEPVKQPSVAPEPVKQPSVAPEPVRQPSVAPEPVRQPTVAPEPVKQPSVAPEPVKQPSVAPEPVRQPTVAPEPVRQPSVAPEPVRQPTVAPEPVRQPTVAPEPVKQPSVAPEPVKQPSVAPEPVRQPSVAPEPVRQPTVAPVPEKMPSVAPEPVRQPTVAPEPVKQPSVAPVPERQPSVPPAPSRQPSMAPARQPSMPRQPSRQPTVAAAPIRQPTTVPPQSRHPTMARIPSKQPSVAPEPELERQPTMMPEAAPRIQDPSPTLYLEQTPQVPPPSYQSILKICEKILNYCPCENEQYDDDYLFGPCRGSLMNDNLRCPFREEDTEDNAPKKDTVTKVPYRIEVSSGVTLCLDEKLRQFLSDPCPCSKKKEQAEEEAARQKIPSAKNLGGPQEVALATQKAREETMEAYEQAYVPRIHREPSLQRQVGAEQYGQPVVHKGRVLPVYEPMPIPRERAVESLYSRPSQIPSPYEQMIGPYQQIDAPYARMDVPYARMDAPFARMEAPYARMEAPFTRMEDPYTRMETTYELAGTPYEQAGTPYEQISGPQGQRRGSSYGGSQKHMIGCSYGQMGDNQRQRRGCGCKTDQMSGAQGQKRGSSYGGSQKQRPSYAHMARTQGQLRRGYGQTNSQGQSSLCSYGPTRSPQGQPRVYPTAQQSASRHRQMNSYGPLAGPYGQFAGTPYGQTAGGTYGHLGGLQGPVNGFPYGQMSGPQNQMSEGPNGQIVGPEQITGNCYLQVAGPSTSRSGILTPTYYRNPRNNYVIDNMEPENSYDDYNQETGVNTLFNRTSIHSGCWQNPPEPRYRKELRKMKSAIAQTMSKRKLKRRSQIGRDADMNANMWT